MKETLSDTLTEYQSQSVHELFCAYRRITHIGAIKLIRLFVPDNLLVRTAALCPLTYMVDMHASAAIGRSSDSTMREQQLLHHKN